MYQLAKLCMFQIYYDFLDYYVDRRDFELDPDGHRQSVLCPIANTLEKAVRPKLVKEFELEKKDWLSWDKWSSREPGLFKLESEGNRFIALCGKCYLVELIQMDTDSLYVALLHDTLEEAVRPELVKEFELEKRDWWSWDKWSSCEPGLFKLESKGNRFIALCSKCYLVGLIQMDTDSLYFALLHDTLEEAVWPELVKEFELEKKNWLSWDKWSSREPGLLKLESEGNRSIALCSKCYLVENEDSGKAKIYFKGMSKTQNELTWRHYEAALAGFKDMATN